MKKIFFLVLLWTSFQSNAQVINCDCLETATLTATPTTGVTYLWSTGFTGNPLVIPSLAPSDEGFYTVTITDCADNTSTDQIEIILPDDPEAVITNSVFGAGPSSVCDVANGEIDFVLKGIALNRDCNNCCEASDYQTFGGDYTRSLFINGVLYDLKNSTLSTNINCNAGTGTADLISIPCEDVSQGDLIEVNVAWSNIFSGGCPFVDNTTLDSYSFIVGDDSCCCDPSFSLDIEPLGFNCSDTTDGLPPGVETFITWQIECDDCSDCTTNTYSNSEIIEIEGFVNGQLSYTGSQPINFFNGLNCGELYEVIGFNGLLQVVFDCEDIVAGDLLTVTVSTTIESDDCGYTYDVSDTFNYTASQDDIDECCEICTMANLDPFPTGLNSNIDALVLTNFFIKECDGSQTSYWSAGGFDPLEEHIIINTIPCPDADILSLPGVSGNTNVSLTTVAANTTANLSSVGIGLIVTYNTSTQEFEFSGDISNIEYAGVAFTFGFDLDDNDCTLIASYPSGGNIISTSENCCN